MSETSAYSMESGSSHRVAKHKMQGWAPYPASLTSSGRCVYSHLPGHVCCWRNCLLGRWLRPLLDLVWGLGPLHPPPSHSFPGPQLCISSWPVLERRDTQLVALVFPEQTWTLEAWEGGVSSLCCELVILSQGSHSLA